LYHIALGHPHRKWYLEDTVRVAQINQSMSRQLLCILLLVVHGLAGCGASGGGDDDVVVDDQPADFKTHLELSERIPTVATVSWNRDPEDVVDAWLEFGLTDGHGTRVTARHVGEGRYEAVLFGMKASSEYHYRAYVETTAGLDESEDETIQTGDVPADLKSPTLTLSEPSASHGGFYVTSVISTPSMAVILDGDGDYVWWYAPTEDHQVTRAQLSRDGEWIRLIDFIPDSEEQLHNSDRSLHRVRIDGTEANDEAYSQAHHDFVEYPDGTIAFLAYDRVDVGEEMVRGDKIVELAPDGTETDVWSVWDHFWYDPEIEYDAELGWSHANSLDYDEDLDEWTLGLRNFGSIVRIDRQTGDILWQFGGEDSDFSGDDEPPFVGQHGFQVIPGGIVVFDNGDTIELNSRAVEYRLDSDQGTASFVWERYNDPPIYSLGLGDVSRWDDGNTLITWSGGGQIEEVTPGGEVVWRVNMDLGAGFGYTTWFESLVD